MFVRHMKKCLIFVLVFLFVLAGSRMAPARAEGSADSTICLLRYEGEVEIRDASGEPRPAEKNAPIGSGEAVVTGEGASASIALSPDRTLTMDADTRVEFLQSGGALELTITMGGLFLDVRDKLGDDETLDIRTANMTVSIRGTIVYIEENPEQRSSTLGVLEGTAEAAYQDKDRNPAQMAVPAGTVVSFSTEDNGSGSQAPAEPVVSPVTQDTLPDYMQDEIWSDPVLIGRVEEGCGWFDYPADGDWTWDGPLTLVAQSASKQYDGQPLTRFSDMLVYGLPQEFSVRAMAGGSQTDAGEAPNPIISYSIYNPAGEDVTSHFTNIQTVEGRLTVDPAPLTIWTGSATKAYDGTPLAAPMAEARSCPGYRMDQPAWRNSAYVYTESSETEVLFGVCGVTWVHATNPLTRETQEIELFAGQKLTIVLHGEGEEQSVEFKVEDVPEDELPEELLRLYADNPDLLAQAAKDTGWNTELLLERFDALPERDRTWEMTEQSALAVEENQARRLMQDYASVSITLDSEVTNYDGKALGQEEVKFTSLYIDESITVTATGSRTEIGCSENTYSIDWGTARPSNYVLTEDLGKLEVTGRVLIFDLGGYTDFYTCDVMLPHCPSCADATLEDFQELCDDEEVATGTVATFSVPGGEIVLKCSGFMDAGSHAIVPEVSLSGTAKDYTLVFTNANLTIKPMEVTVCLHDGSEVKYDGEEHSGNFSASGGGHDLGFQTETLRGFAWGGDRVIVNVTGFTEPGTYTLSCTFTYECNPDNYHITVTNTQMTIVSDEPSPDEPITIGTGSAPQPLG